MGSEDEKYMEMALNLAGKGTGSVEPNPAVGAVIVKTGQVIGKGWHKEFGGPHAEINALEDCKNLGTNPAGGIMYVTLEPCCHQGKTRPCTDVIVKAGLAKVVVAMIDPSEHARGKGVEQLRKTGIEVEVGVCEQYARVLNAPFIKFTTTGKSWVVVKWAQSVDGKMAWADDVDERWISNEQSREDAHKLRRRCGAILVGIETVLADNPLLTPRPSRGKKPIRVVLDSQLRIPLDCKLLVSAGEAPVIVVSGKEAAKTEAAEQIRQRGVEVLVCRGGHNGSNLEFVLEELGNRNVQQVLVEGGAKVITSFLGEKLADEVCVYISPKKLGPQGAIDISEPMAKLSQAVGLYHVETKKLDDDIRISGLTKNK